jgi:hypothetical protein
MIHRISNIVKRIRKQITLDLIIIRIIIIHCFQTLYKFLGTTN